MEYGYEITTTAGDKTFFVEGCTCCRMSTGGQHEMNCPSYKQGVRVRISPDETEFMDDNLRDFYRKKGYLYRGE